MNSPAPRLSVSLLLCALLLWSPPRASDAQTRARATHADEDPLAAALRLAGAAEGFEKENVFLELTTAHLAAGRLEEGARTAAALEDGGTKAMLLAHVADAFAEAGSLDRAFELLKESLRTLEDASDSNAAAQLLREVVGGAAPKQDEFAAPRGSVGGSALARLVEAGRAQAAAGILSRVREAALDPDFDDEDAACVLARVARLYLRVDASRASAVLSESLAAARRVEDEYQKVTVLCEVATAHASAGDVRTAEALLDEAQRFASSREHNRGRELPEVVRAYASAGLTAKAQNAARELGGGEGALAALDAAPGGPLKESLAPAVEAAASLEGESVRATRLAALARAYGAGSPELLSKVAEAARALTGGYYRGRVLVAVGDAHAEAKREAEAVEAWEQALEAGRSIELKREDLHKADSRMNDVEKLRLIGAAARRLVGVGRYAVAPEAARDIWATHLRARSLVEGSAAVARGGEAELARLADELTRAGRKTDALEVLGAAGAAWTPAKNENPYEHAPGLAALGAAYARAGDETRAAACLRRALEVAAEAEDSGHKLLLLSGVAARYAEAGLRPDARARRSLRRLVRDIEAER